MNKQAFLEGYLQKSSSALGTTYAKGAGAMGSSLQGPTNSLNGTAGKAAGSTRGAWSKARGSWRKFSGGGSSTPAAKAPASGPGTPLSGGASRFNSSLQTQTGQVASASPVTSSPTFTQASPSKSR